MFGRPELVIEHGERDLEAENRALRAQLEEMSTRLAREAAHRAELEAALGELRVAGDRARDNVYVFDDGDDSTDAFDRFFASPDPHLDKVRGFLLD